MLLSGGLIKIIAVLYAADKVCSLLSTSFGLSAPYLGFAFGLRALKPAVMAVRVSFFSFLLYWHDQILIIIRQGVPIWNFEEQNKKTKKKNKKNLLTEFLTK